MPLYIETAVSPRLGAGLGLEAGVLHPASLLWACRGQFGSKMCATRLGGLHAALWTGLFKKTNQAKQQDKAVGSHHVSPPLLMASTLSL